MSGPSPGYQDASRYNLADSFAELNVGTSEVYKEEQFDSRFAVADKPSRFFNVGRVFKTLWIEPAGSTATDTDRKPYHTVGYGQLSYAKVRRFVVIRKRLHSCLCLMISTYGGQGAAKEDARSHDHAVVYSSQDQEPLPRPEENVTLGAFPIIIEEAGEDLGAMSRLDFGKVYTVEHNVKVLKIGRILPDQIKRLNETFAKTMGFPPPLDNSDPDEPDSQPGEEVTATKIYTPMDRKMESSFPSRYISGTPGQSEKLDPSYNVRNRDYRKFFRIGRVFSTLWSETGGVNADRIDPDSFSEVAVYGERVYSRVCRFVVVREGDRSCTCLQVTSYDGAGHRKQGIRLGEHGFIYSRNTPAKVDGMRSKPLKVILARGSPNLKDPSLINYGKVYTVEVNVKVKDVGELDADSKRTLLHYFRKVFSEIEQDPPGPGFTPRASEAQLAGIGGMEQLQPPPPLGSSHSPAGFADPDTSTSISPISTSEFSLSKYVPDVTTASSDGSIGYPSLNAYGYNVAIGGGYGDSAYRSQFSNNSYTSYQSAANPYYATAGGYPPVESYAAQPSGYTSQAVHSYSYTQPVAPYDISSPPSTYRGYSDSHGGNVNEDEDEEVQLQSLEGIRSSPRRDSGSDISRTYIVSTDTSKHGRRRRR